MLWSTVVIIINRLSRLENCGIRFLKQILCLDGSSKAKNSISLLFNVFFWEGSSSMLAVLATIFMSVHNCLQKCPQAMLACLWLLSCLQVRCVLRIWMNYYLSRWSAEDYNSPCICSLILSVNGQYMCSVKCLLDSSFIYLLTIPCTVIFTTQIADMKIVIGTKCWPK